MVLPQEGQEDGGDSWSDEEADGAEGSDAADEGEECREEWHVEGLADEFRADELIDEEELDCSPGEEREGVGGMALGEDDEGDAGEGERGAAWDECCVCGDDGEDEWEWGACEVVGDTEEEAFEEGDGAEAECDGGEGLGGDARDGGGLVSWEESSEGGGDGGFEVWGVDEEDDGTDGGDDEVEGGGGDGGGGG